MCFHTYFGKYTMIQYPPAAKRKYKSTTTYRDFTIAVYGKPDDSPIFEIGEVPIRELFFVLDDMGDNVFPIDVPVSSVFHAFAAIDMYHRCDTPEWLRNNPVKTKWNYVRENIQAGFKFVALMDFSREILGDIQGFDPDPDFGDDPVKWRDATAKKMQDFFSGLTGYKSVDEIVTDLDESPKK